MSVLPSDFEFEHLPGDRGRYVLPRRALGPVKKFVNFAMLFGILFALVPAAGILIAILNAFRQPRFDLFDLFPLVIAVPFLVVGLLIAGFAILMARGHAEIELAGEWLIMRERAGLLRWTRKVQVARLKCFRIAQGSQDQETKELAALTADVGESRPRWIVIGYPTQLLESLANELATSIDSTGKELRVEIEDLDTIRAGVAEEPEQIDLKNDIKTRPLLSQPKSSRTTCERYEGGGITLNVPSAGLIKGSRGLFLFGLLWTIMSCIIGSVMVVSMIKSGQFSGLFIAVPVLLLFLSVGAIMLVAGVNMGTRRVAVAVFDGRLMLMQKSVFGTKKLEWNCEQIDFVVAGPSGMTVNDVPVLELQIQSKDGKTGLLAGHDDQELHWLADEVHQAIAAQKNTQAK